MNIQEEIIKSIAVMIDKSLEEQDSKLTKTKAGIVKSINDDRYQVEIDGVEYNVYDSVGCDPGIGKGVWVQIPNGRVTDAFITGLRGNAEGGGGGGGGRRYQADWLETNPNSPSYIRNKLNNIYFDMAVRRENIQSGESFSVLFGKIARYFNDLGNMAFKNNVNVSDITDFESTMATLLSKPIPDALIYELFEEE